MHKCDLKKSLMASFSSSRPSCIKLLLYTMAIMLININRIQYLSKEPARPYPCCLSIIWGTTGQHFAIGLNIKKLRVWVFQFDSLGVTK